MKPSRKFLAVSVALLLLSACNLPANTPDPGSDLAATFVALTLQGASLPGAATPAGGSPSVPQASETPGLPTLTLEPSQTPTKEITPTPRPGSITGGIYGYPYGDIPQLRVVAFNQDSAAYWYRITVAGDVFYSMDGYIPPGSYQVVAYDPASHAGGCVIIVQALSDQAVNCDITDWAGVYRAKPAGVP
ncbi:MAG: hypothetical protein FJZ96_06925 [Chloroflexi bacterium]|nr:hypothetical protein [Chloroflexota bacterium]